MGLSSRKKRIFLFIFLVICVGVLLFLLRNITVRTAAKKAAGIYIISGGESYLVLKSDLWGTLRATGGKFNTIYFPGPSGETSFDVKIHNGKMLLNQDTVYSTQYGTKGKPSILKVDFQITCIPGKSYPRDWDLAKAELKIMEFSGESILSGKFWRDITSSDSMSEFKNTVSEHIGGTDLAHYSWDAKENPCNSILHRVDDQRVVQYFRMRETGKNEQDALKLMREISRDHPEDPFINLHRVEMEALQGDPEIAFDLLKKWGETHGSFPNPLLKRIAENVSKNVSLEITRKKYADWESPLDIFQGKDQDLNEMLEFFKKFLSWEQLYFVSLPIINPGITAGYTGLPIPNFLSFQVCSKVARVMATLQLFQGKREESLELFASIYRMGQALNSHGSFIQRLIGIAIRAIAAEGLKIHVLNACETEEEFKNCQVMLDRLNNTPGQEDGSRLLDGEFTPIQSNMKILSGIMFPNILEAETRHKASDMRFQLVRMACAAKYRLLISGDFPSTKEDFAPFLSEGLPWDSFTEKDPLSFTRLSPKEMVVYSHGPDKDDDHAAIIYDPTNGTITDGDIFITIPREREFPFPRKAVRAANAYEILEQFPNGLPADTFAYTKYLPLSIIESTDKTPVIIFSFGPNTDEKSSSTSGFHPFAPGVFPVGGFPGMNPPMKETPTPTPTPPPIATPDPGANPSPNRLLQKVYGRSESAASAPGYRYLESMYDPTNGTISDGDLFIEIPR